MIGAPSYHAYHNPNPYNSEFKNPLYYNAYKHYMMSQEDKVQRTA